MGAGLILMAGGCGPEQLCHQCVVAKLHGGARARPAAGEGSKGRIATTGRASG